MKKIGWLSLIVALLLGQNVFASALETYEAFAAALRARSRFVVVLDLQQCAGDTRLPVGYFIPNALLLIPKTETVPERIATSHLQFTDHLGTPAYEYVKYTFYADNRVTIQVVLYDPQTFKPASAGHTLQCTLGQGVVVYTLTD